MEPKADVLFREISFMVARLIFGDTEANKVINQRLIQNSLVHLGLRTLLEKALQPSEPVKGTDAT